MPKYSIITTRINNFSTTQVHASWAFESFSMGGKLPNLLATPVQNVQIFLSKENMKTNNGLDFVHHKFYFMYAKQWWPQTK